jgi:hypothetical protein
VVTNVVRGLGALTVAVLLGYMIFQLRRERRLARAGA